MTEDAWLTCTNPRLMLDFLRGRTSERKLRLFAVACCRRIWRLLPDDKCKEAVQVAENFADGKADSESLWEVQNAGEFYSGNRDYVPGERLGYFAGGAIFQLGEERPECVRIAHAASEAVAYSTLDEGSDRIAAGVAKHSESTSQCNLIRCIFGNPYKVTHFDESWLTWNNGTVVKVAEAIYQERAFDKLPILGDSLEEAGCTHDDILGHCRKPGLHTRGCWVVDLLTGREKAMTETEWLDH